MYAAAKPDGRGIGHAALSRSWSRTQYCAFQGRSGPAKLLEGAFVWQSATGA